MSLTGYLLAAASLLLALLTILAVRRATYWRAQARQLLDADYLSPPATLVRRLLFKVIGWIYTFLYIGPVTVIGKDNIRGKRRFITLLNHQTERDAILSPYLFIGHKRVRYFIAGNRIEGIRGPIVAFTGGIAVPFDQKRGPALALVKAIGAMVEEPDTSFIIFPQGTLVRSNELNRKDFYNGVAVLGKRVASKAGDELDYLPSAIHYLTDRKYATRFHRLVNFLGWKNFRAFWGAPVYGAIVVVGERIPLATAPEDVDATMDLLFNRIVELNAEAQRIAATM